MCFIQPSGTNTDINQFSPNAGRVGDELLFPRQQHDSRGAPLVVRANHAKPVSEMATRDGGRTKATKPRPFIGLPSNQLCRYPTRGIGQTRNNQHDE